MSEGDSFFQDDALVFWGPFLSLCSLLGSMELCVVPKQKKKKPAPHLPNTHRRLERIHNPITFKRPKEKSLHAIPSRPMQPCPQIGIAQDRP